MAVPIPAPSLPLLTSRRGPENLLEGTEESDPSFSPPSLLNLTALVEGPIQEATTHRLALTLDKDGH
jgi:hypothetical protein